MSLNVYVVVVYCTVFVRALLVVFVIFLRLDGTLFFKWFTVPAGAPAICEDCCANVIVDTEQNVSTTIQTTVKRKAVEE